MKTQTIGLQEQIIEQLAGDRALESSDIAVLVNGGVVTLRGTVQGLWHKWSVEDAVKRIAGVSGIVNEIAVELPTVHVRNDTDIALAIERRFLSNALIPKSIQFVVERAVVTLTGKAELYHQALEAELEVQRVIGVRNICNEITIEPTVALTESQILQSIRHRLEYDADVDADSIEAIVNGNAVTLSGTVRSIAEREAAAAAVWRLHGVTHLNNFLVVIP